MTIHKVEYEGVPTILSYAVQELTRRGLSSFEILRMYPSAHPATIKWAARKVRKEMKSAGQATRKITFEMIESAVEKLCDEAKARKMPVGQFVALLIDAILTDNMIDAVLDMKDIAQ